MIFCGTEFAAVKVSISNSEFVVLFAFIGVNEGECARIIVKGGVDRTSRFQNCPKTMIRSE